MKKYTKLTSLILGATLLFSAFGTACNAEETEEKEKVEVTEVTYDGTHIYDAPDTDDYLVKNGTTQYTLVIPEDNTAMIRTARDEFIDLFCDATNITINTTTDAGLTHNASSRYISIGETTLLESSGIQINYEELGQDGHRIVTKDNNIYLIGGMDEGTLFAVYTFMKVTFNFETYYYDTMEIERTNEKKLKAYNVTDIPDFKHRGSQTNVLQTESYDYDESMYEKRMYLYGSRGYHFMKVHKTFDPDSHGITSTNAHYWLAEATYPDHPDWFSVNGGNQLCFTAHDREGEEYQLMLEECLKKIIFSLRLYTYEEYPELNCMTLTQEDNLLYCTCDECAAIAKEYETQAAVQMLFMNDLAEMLDEWLAENPDDPGYREDFTLLFFAYQYTIDAPAYYDVSTKTYKPIDGSYGEIVLHDRVGVYLAITNADGQMPFFSETNQEARSNVEGWCALTDYVYYWNYGTNFRNFIWMYDSFVFYTPEAYAWFANLSDRMWFQQMQTSSQGANTAWHNLKTYLDCKLSWDTSLDMEELVDNWFNAMFKDAAPRMKRLFMEQRSYVREVLIGEYGLHAVGDGRPDQAKQEYWSLPVLQSWLATYDEAIEDVERYKFTDPDLYARIVEHIDAESISTLYVILDVFNSTIAPADKASYIDRLKGIMLKYDYQEMHMTASANFYDYVMAL